MAVGDHKVILINIPGLMEKDPANLDRNQRILDEVISKKGVFCFIMTYQNGSVVDGDLYLFREFVSKNDIPDKSIHIIVNQSKETFPVNELANYISGFAKDKVSGITCMFNNDPNMKSKMLNIIMDNLPQIIKKRENMNLDINSLSDRLGEEKKKYDETVEKLRQEEKMRASAEAQAIKEKNEADQQRQIAENQRRIAADNLRRAEEAERNNRRNNGIRITILGRRII